MADKKYRVIKSNVTEMNAKISRHRKKILFFTALAVITLLIILAGYYLYIQTRVYTSYDVLDTIKREDSPGTQFTDFDGNILKYGKDGAACIDLNNRVIWNQAYEMQEPMTDICGGYAAIADEKGKQVYIMDKRGSCGQIETAMPIRRVQVANQGTAAILMAQDGSGYLQVYDKEGTFLAEGRLHTKNSGYPLDIAMSHDGKKLAVALLDVNDGNLKTTITFYNFGAAGQNEIDNIVGQYSYDGLLIPKVEFLTNDVMVAFGAGKAVIFEGGQKPQQKNEVVLEQEIQSIFYNDTYFGFVFAGGQNKAAYEMQVYNLDGAEILAKGFSMGYQSIGFLDNDEIYIINDLECQIVTLRGVEKFHGEFEKGIRKIVPAGGFRNYVFLVDGETQKIRLK